MKNKKKNSAWPIDIVILPAEEDSNVYLEDIRKWMKTRYSSDAKIIKIK